MEKKLNNASKNIGMAYHTILLQMKQELLVQNKYKDQYEKILQTEIEKLEGLKNVSDEFDLQNIKVRDLNMKLQMCEEAIAEFTAGLIEHGEI